jgi:hypothetical protein
VSYPTTTEPVPYISVRNWRKFQHYDPAKRAPIFVKNYTELMADDAYLDLTEHRALMLHRLWLEYASARCRLSLDTRSLSRRLNLRVTTADIEALNHAGFIDIVASEALADGYQDASSRARARSKEKRREETKAVRSKTTAENQRPEIFNQDLLRDMPT